jgi:hypothetical protein
VAVSERRSLRKKIAATHRSGLIVAGFRFGAIAESARRINGFAPKTLTDQTTWGGENRDRLEEIGMA